MDKNLSQNTKHSFCLRLCQMQFVVFVTCFKPARPLHVPSTSLVTSAPFSLKDKNIATSLSTSPRSRWQSDQVTLWGETSIYRYPRCECVFFVNRSPLSLTHFFALCVSSFLPCLIHSFVPAAHPLLSRHRSPSLNSQTSLAAFQRKFYQVRGRSREEGQEYQKHQRKVPHPPAHWAQPTAGYQSSSSPFSTSAHLEATFLAPSI